MTAKTEKDNERSKDQAMAQFESIKELVKWLEHTQSCTDDDCKQGEHGGDYWDNRNEYHNEGRARETVDQDPLSVEIRSDWHFPGETVKGGEFKILLCTGGPAVRIIGELTEYGEPDTAELQHQDWFTEWQDCYLDEKDTEILLTYCRYFYFGE